MLCDHVIRIRLCLPGSQQVTRLCTVPRRPVPHGAPESVLHLQGLDGRSRPSDSLSSSHELINPCLILRSARQKHAIFDPRAHPYLSFQHSRSNIMGRLGRTYPRKEPSPWSCSKIYCCKVCKFSFCSICIQK